MLSRETPFSRRKNQVTPHSLHFRISSLISIHYRYQWYKKTPPSSEFDFYKETDSAVLTFDPLCPENNGYYFCQAEVTGEIDESNEVCVRGKSVETGESMCTSP